jgi:hypothetical protein
MHTQDAGGRFLDGTTINATIAAAVPSAVYGTDYTLASATGKLAITNLTLMPDILRAVLADVEVLVEESRVAGAITVSEAEICKCKKSPELREPDTSGYATFKEPLDTFHEVCK